MDVNILDIFESLTIIDKIISCYELVLPALGPIIIYPKKMRLNTKPFIFSQFLIQFICLWLGLFAIGCSGDQAEVQTILLRYPKRIKSVETYLSLYNRQKESSPSAIIQLLAELIMSRELLDFQQLDSLEKLTDFSSFSLLDSVYFNLTKGIICRQKNEYIRADSLMHWVYSYRDLLHPSDRAYLLDELGIIRLFIYNEDSQIYFEEEYEYLKAGDFTYPSTKNYFYCQAFIQKQKLDFDLAVTYAKSAIDHAKNEKFEDSIFRGKCINLLANIHFEKKEYHQARINYRESLKLVSGNTINTIKENLARCLVYLDSLDSAEEIILENIHAKERLQKSYSILGLILIDKGDYLGAIDAYKSCLEHTPRKAVLSRVEALRGLGIARYELRDFDESIQDFEACLSWIDDEISNGASMSTLEFELYLIESIRTHAWIAINHMEKEQKYNGSDYTEFLHHYALIDSMLILSKQLVHENIQRSLSNEYKQIFIAGINRLFRIKETGIACELKRVIDSRILKWFDHNKSNSLYQQRQAILNSFNVSNENVPKLLSLQSRLLNIYNRPFGGSTYSSIRKLNDSISNLKPFPISKASYDIDSIQAKLSKEDVVIAYLQSRDKFYLYILTKDTLHINYIKHDSLINAKIERYKKLVSNEPRSSKSNYYDPLARNLYQELLGNFTSEIKQKKNWYVLGDGLLDNFPFESLIYPSDPASKFADYKYLICNHRITNGFSLRLLLDHLTPDTINYSSVSILSGPTDEMGFVDEKKYIEDLIKKHDQPILFNEILTKNDYHEVIQDRGIVHIVSHAYADPLSMSRSYILMEKDTNFMGDIYAFPVKSDLIVLSACNTRQGAYYSGEGVYSFARSFYMLGARHIVSTTWKVPVNLVPELMSNFYQGLFNKENINTALYNSKLQYLDQADLMHRHPYFWAGINSYGDQLVFY